MNLKGIKKLVNYGLISLIGLNLFVGCSSPFEPEEISTITFELDTRLEKDDQWLLPFTHRYNKVADTS